MGWVVNATTRPLYPRERPKDVREFTVILYGYETWFPPQGRTLTDGVSEQGVKGNVQTLPDLRNS